MRIGVLTSGGDAPGMNAAIQGAVKAGISRGHEVIGIENGYEGLLDETASCMGARDVDSIARFGGTVLGTARSQRFPTEAGQVKAAHSIENLGLDALIVIGGNGSLTGAHVLGQRTRASLIGVPASIDNDIGHTSLCIGVDTAVNTIVEACDRISDTARSHRRAFIVEVMGRQCGYLAMRAGLAADADAILFAERDLDPDVLLEKLHALLVRSFSETRDKGRVLIVKAEGVKMPTHELAQQLAARASDIEGVSVRETVLGHVVRGGSPSATDRVIAKRLSYGAVLAAEAGRGDVMAAWQPGDVGEKSPDTSVRWVSLPDVLEETARLLDGTSPTTRARIRLLEATEGILAL